VTNPETYQRAADRLHREALRTRRIVESDRDLSDSDRAKLVLHAEALELVLGHRQKLLNIAHAAEALESYLGANVGETKDWPLRIVADEDVAAKCVADLLNALKEALKK
jgi:signal transduction histidine kinase